MVSLHTSCLVLWTIQVNLKGESELFSIPVLMLHIVAAILVVMYGGELLYLQIWRDLQDLSLPWDSQRDNHYVCVGKATFGFLGRLSCKKRGTISLLHVTPRWSPQQIPPLNFLEKITHDCVVYRASTAGLRCTIGQLPCQRNYSSRSISALVWPRVQKAIQAIVSVSTLWLHSCTYQYDWYM